MITTLLYITSKESHMQKYNIADVIYATVVYSALILAKLTDWLHKF